jgi:phosphate-selective porin OprO/OprP
MLHDGSQTITKHEARRLMFRGAGYIHKDLYVFALFSIKDEQFKYSDVFLKYTLPEQAGELYAGVFPEPTGLEMRTSSKYISFVERAMMTATQEARSNPGLMYSNHQLLGEKLGLEIAYTINKDLPLREWIAAGDYASNLTGRFMLRPFIIPEKRLLMHLAVNLERRTSSNDEYHLSFRPETHSWNKIDYSDSLEVQYDYGMEFAMNWQSLSIQAEYELSRQFYAGTQHAIHAYYAYLSYFFTGESRNYKKGAYSRITPRKAFNPQQGGWGALELLFRYSAMDFSRGHHLAYVEGEALAKLCTTSLALNWYLNDHIRLMYNLVTILPERRSAYVSNIIRLNIEF